MDAGEKGSDKLRSHTFFGDSIENALDLQTEGKEAGQGEEGLGVVTAERAEGPAGGIARWCLPDVIT